MASALSAAHSEQIIHRDFKSQNVMLVGRRQESPEADMISTAELRVVVTDFGLARVVAEDGGRSLTMGDFVGSPSYMAPEQIEGGAVTPPTDIYALGVVMYEMITGTQPFIGETPLATAIERLKEPAPSPRLHLPDLDPRWAESSDRQPMIVPRTPATNTPAVGPVWRSSHPGPARDNSPATKPQGRVPSLQAGIRFVTGEAKTLTDSALLLYRHGNLEARVAEILDDEGDVEQARQTQNRALSIYAATGERPGTAKALDVAVHVAIHKGDLNTARERTVSS
jgi:serine/threonine protein kinase